MIAAALHGFTLTFRNQSLLPIQRIKLICGSGWGRQLSRAVPSPKAHCACATPWFPDNINARQMSLNKSRDCLNISRRWTFFVFMPTKTHSPSSVFNTTSTSTTNKLFSSPIAGESMDLLSRDNTLCVGYTIVQCSTVMTTNRISVRFQANFNHSS